jgi:periplasmic protein TonB
MGEAFLGQAERAKAVGSWVVRGRVRWGLGLSLAFHIAVLSSLVLLVHSAPTPDGEVSSIELVMVPPERAAASPAQQEAATPAVAGPEHEAAPAPPPEPLPEQPVPPPPEPVPEQPAIRPPEPVPPPRAASPPEPIPEQPANPPPEPVPPPPAASSPEPVPEQPANPPPEPVPPPPTATPAEPVPELPAVPPPPPEPPPPEPTPKPRAVRVPHPPRQAPTQSATPSAPSHPSVAATSGVPAPSSAPSPSAPEQQAAPSGAKQAWLAGVSAWLMAHRSYPEMARALGRQGTVVVQMTVDPEGHVTEVNLVRGSGTESLDHAAEELVRGAHLPPFPPDMKLSQQSVTVPIHYRLE